MPLTTTLSIYNELHSLVPLIIVEMGRECIDYMFIFILLTKYKLNVTKVILPPT